LHHEGELNLKQNVIYGAKAETGNLPTFGANAALDESNFSSGRAAAADILTDIARLLSASL
jgi:hypothetical protein